MALAHRRRKRPRHPRHRNPAPFPPEVIWVMGKPKRGYLREAMRRRLGA